MATPMSTTLRTLALAALLGTGATPGCMTHAGAGNEPAASGDGSSDARAMENRTEPAPDPKEAAEALARVDPKELRAASERAGRLASVTMGFMNTMAAFAAPQVLAKAKRLPTREEMLECIDAYLEVIQAPKRAPGADPAMTAAALPVLRLRELFSAWTPSPVVPAEIVQNARAALQAFGVPEPPGGWDRFEVPPGEVPPSPEN